MAELLTPTEKEIVELLGQAASKFRRIVGPYPHGEHDVAEFVHHIHACQQAVLSQAAGRAYPDTYRLMGYGFDDKAPPSFEEQARNSAARTERGGT